MKKLGFLVRVTLAVILGAAMLLTQTSCGGGGRGTPASAGAVKPRTVSKVTPQNKQNSAVYFGEDVTVVRHNGRTRIEFRDQDGDGIPDEE